MVNLIVSKYVITNQIAQTADVCKSNVRNITY